MCNSVWVLINIITKFFKCLINKINHTTSHRRLKFQGSRGTSESERNDKFSDLLTYSLWLNHCLFLNFLDQSSLKMNHSAWSDSTGSLKRVSLPCPFLQFKATHYGFFFFFYETQWRYLKKIVKYQSKITEKRFWK